MSNVLIAFITGLTTGGLSCLAVQGGLLASSLARQLEQDMQSRSPVMGRSKKRGVHHPSPQPRLAAPILLFLGAKVLAYTILGFLLGMLGSVLTLNITLRAVLLLAIGVFMVGNALRMFDVHPIFRYFVIEPPSFLTRYIRKKAKTGASFVTPVFLGAMTVLIPCGITQAMMAVAMATGSPFQGAAIMAAFTLGASPVFFTVAYLATQLGSRIERFFMRFVAATVLILGLVSVNNGLNLMGSPYSATNLIRSATQSQSTNADVRSPGASAASDGSLSTSADAFILDVRNDGYSPGVLHAAAGKPVTLTLVTNKTYSWSRSFVIPKLGLEKVLPATGSVPIEIPAQKAGSVLRFTCSMGMYGGQIVFDQ